MKRVTTLSSILLKVGDILYGASGGEYEVHQVNMEEKYVVLMPEYTHFSGKRHERPSKWSNQIWRIPMGQFDFSLFFKETRDD